MRKVAFNKEVQLTNCKEVFCGKKFNSWTEKDCYGKMHLGFGKVLSGRNDYERNRKYYSNLFKEQCI